MDESNTKAEFTAKGAWISTEWAFPIEYTPQAIKDTIAKKYAGYKIKEISVSEFPGRWQIICHHDFEKERMHEGLLHPEERIQERRKNGLRQERQMLQGYQEMR